MADSDDDYDRKRRDKFRGERNEYREMGGRRPPPNDDMRSRRDDWGAGGGGSDRGGGGGDWANRGRGPPRAIDYRLGGGHRVQHEFSPPNKRPRVEWDRYSHESSGYGSGYGGGFDGPPPPQHMMGGGYNQPPQHQPPQMSTHKEGPDGYPHMLSFKAWLSTQDDQISDQDALTKYADYKKEFKRQQLNEFFVAHREEEWFRNKYHPDEYAKRRDEQFQNLKTRVNTFVEFLDSGRFSGVGLDATQSEKIIKLMDWYVIRLEGGSNEDAAKLLSEEAIMKPRPALLPKPDEKIKEVEVKKAEPVKKDNKENGEDSDGSQSGSESEDDKNSDDEGRIRKRKKEKKTSTSAVEALEAALETNHSIKSEDEREDGNMDDDASNDESKKRAKNRKRSGDSDKGSDVSDAEIDADDNNDKAKKSEDEMDDEDDDDEGGIKKKKDKKKNIITNVQTSSLSKDSKRELEEEEMPQLHRTSSIFLRNLSPLITKQEVEALCKKYSGFLRVAIADPQADRRWIRRGWVTFKRNVNIKEICWNLNSIRLRDSELGPIVNRDLSRRVRTINGITPHKTIVRNDIRLAAKVIQHLDAKWNLWDEDLQQETKQESYGVYSTNPVLKNITDHLIEEASAEEEELLGLSNSDGELDADREEKNNSVERDDELIKVLDRLLFYLRFVHSLDYYNHAEYPYEDEMPNRLGIVHARGMPPATKVNVMEVQEYNRNFESKISTFIQPNVTLTDEECKDLGMKDEEGEVEKFIVVNTKELGKDKWLCPLSGKKFKGPEFVRKHICNKHGEKLEEVKKEVVFFNNFLKDPKRPASPEPQRGGDRGNQQQQTMQQRRDGGPMQERDFHPPPLYPPYGGGYNSGYGGGGGGMYGGPPGRPQQSYQPYRQDFPPRVRPGFRTGGRDFGNRSIISYRDLDAPNEPDDF